MTVHDGSCGCCETASRDLDRGGNPRGLTAIAYRLGTHGAFKSAMQADLSRRSPLRKLTTRDPSDPTIALIDAWASVLDVLTFYQERIANEGYLRTATERRSVLELARQVGYELKPGVAAETSLAFELETAEGSPEVVAIPAATRVQSIPGPGEEPQVFETVEEVESRREYNAIDLRTEVRRIPELGDTEVFLAGTATALAPGDGILIVGRERETDPTRENWDFRIVSEVDLDRSNGRTRVAWREGLGRVVSGYTVTPAQKDVKVYAFRRRAYLFGYNAPDWRAMALDVKKAYDSTVTVSAQGTEWPNFEIPHADENAVDLDALYPKVVAGSWVVLRRPAESDEPEYSELYGVTKVEETGRSDYTMSAKVTRLTLEGENLADLFEDRIRETVVFCESERLELAAAPILDPLQGDSLEPKQPLTSPPDRRAGIVSGKRPRLNVIAPEGELTFDPDAGSDPEDLMPGESLVVVAPFLSQTDRTRTWTVLRGDVRGTVVARLDQAVPASAESDDELVAEQVEVRTAAGEQRSTTLALESELVNCYDRSSVSVCLNVASATHGETFAEVLGGGDAARAFQRFDLSRTNLTYAPADNPSGAESTLVLRVDDVAWTEVPSFFGLGPRDRAYVVRNQDDGKSTVEFGDGVNGARLPSGIENVRSTYRAGKGRAGMLAARQLSLLMNPPLGVRKAVNPFPPGGGEDPETLDAARENAPSTLLTFDRIVSLSDYAHFARTFSGIDKAEARWLWDGQSRIVLITVVGAEGDAVAAGSSLHRRLLAAVRASAAPKQAVVLESFEHLSFRVSASVVVDERFDANLVLASVAARLMEAYSLPARALAQPVTSSELIARMQGVEGVEGVDLDRLHLAGDSPSLQRALAARPGRRENETIRPAQLLTLAPDGLELTVGT